MPNHHILVIDDEVQILKALERTLKPLATVHTASSGEAGFQLVGAHPISLIICDQRMPQMSGIEFFRRIAQEHPHIIRIILTAYTDVEDLIEAINEVGLYRYITKPWDNRDLQLIIKRALEWFDLSAHNRQLVQELQKANTELEQKVATRTKELHESNTQLKSLSVTDSLTDIGNQRYFRDQLRSEMERSIRYRHPLSLLLIDVDYFKQYNDAYGHAIGDKALKLVAKVLKSNTRSTDFLARYGGEEFGIILPETPKKDAHLLAERVRKAIEKQAFSYKIKGRPRKGLTVSIGVCCYPTDHKGKDPKQLLIKADKALYLAKQKGRNRTESL